MLMNFWRICCSAICTMPSILFFYQEDCMQSKQITLFGLPKLKTPFPYYKESILAWKCFNVLIYSLFTQQDCRKLTHLQSTIKHRTNNTPLVRAYKIWYSATVSNYMYKHQVPCTVTNFGNKSSVVNWPWVFYQLFPFL